MAASGPALIRRWAPTDAYRALSVTWPEHSIDVSNYQRELTDEWFEHWRALGYRGLIVQAVTGMDGRSYTRQQCQAGLDHGWEIASYVWCSRGDGMSDSRFRARLELIEPYVSPMHFLALDVEESGLQVEDVDADLMLCDEVKGDAPFYTGHWVFANQGWLHVNYWAARRLWDSNYDRVANVDHGFRPYGGWHEAWLKQYTDEPLDLNICRVGP